MSKIDDLIKQHCPDGVEFMELEQLLDYEQPGRYIVDSTNYSDSHKIPVLTAGQSFILGYTDEDYGIYKASKKEPVIIFDDFTTSFHWVDFGFKVKSSAMKMLRPKDGVPIEFRFLYFAMRCIRYKPTDHARHWISQYSKFKIPVPPLKVQRAIVEILDKFTSLEAELEAELEARKKQYEFYRNQLLSFDESGGAARWTTLGEVAMYSKDRIKATILNTDNYVGVDNILQNRQGKTTSSYVPTAGNLTQFDSGDVLLGNIRPYLRKIWHADKTGGTNGDVLVIKLKDKDITPRYLYQVLADDKFFDYEMKHAKGAKMPRGDKASIMKYPVPVPPIAEQNRIVSILDKFDTLVNDISEGLPAEINARRQQYEYYRSKLLTFTELAA